MKIIAYYRVSTGRQGKSGLGLDAQRQAVQAFASQSRGKIVGEYREIETGTNKRNRPTLKQAIAHARAIKATLVIAKLDRLARNVHLVSGLLESKVDFVACDQPHANKLTIHILAAVAEAEAEAISQRTRDALAAAKRRGVKLGNPENLTAEARAKGAIAGAAKRRANAVDGYAHILPTMQRMRSEGRSLAYIAQRLNDDGHTTAKGAAWSATQVMRAMQRAGV